MASIALMAYVPLFFPDRPDPPRNLRATEVYSDYIVMAWDEPESDGGAPITEYQVEKCDAAKQAFFSAGNTDAATRTLKVTKLIEGHDYNFRVYAENEIGQSDPCASTEPIKARLPFGKCTNMG